MNVEPTADERGADLAMRPGTIMTRETSRGHAAGMLPEHARVVVVGGGVIGSSIAYHLTKLGWGDVVLLERKQLTAGTTWHAAGLITSAGCATESLLWMARYTRDLCTSLEAETGQATGFRPIGHLSVATTPERLEALRREAAFTRGFGVSSTTRDGTSTLTTPRRDSSVSIDRSSSARRLDGSRVMRAAKTSPDACSSAT